MSSVRIVVALAICGTLLAMPTFAVANPHVSVQSVATVDTNGSGKATFAPGEGLRFAAQVNGMFGGGTKIYTQFRITTNYGYSFVGRQNVSDGPNTLYWPLTAPQQPGTYTASVEVFDDDPTVPNPWSPPVTGTFTVAATAVTPPPPRPTPTPLSCTAGLPQFAAGTHVGVGEPATYPIFHPQGTGALTATIRWGDGAQETHTFAEYGTYTFRHSYRVIGSYPVSLTLNGMRGDKACGDANVPLGPVNVTDKLLLYTALGDSYSAGEGNPPFEKGTNSSADHNFCHRSRKDSPVLGAYPLILRNVLPGRLGEPNFRACSGAKIEDFFASQTGNRTQPGQLSAIRPTDNLVTLTIGGNNVGFPEIIATCVRNDGCQQKVYNKRKDLKVIDAVKVATRLHKPLVDLFRRIRGKMDKQGYLVVGGYPHFFWFPKTKKPPTDTCEAHISWSEGQFLNGLINHGDEVLARAVSSVNDSHVVFVDIRDAFRRHELCGEKAPYLRGLNLLDHWEYSYHPTLEGQAAYARAFALRVTSLTGR